MFADFASLSVLAFPEGRKEYATDPRESPQNHVKLPPEEHMLCYDYLYYVCAHQVGRLHTLFRRGASCSCVDCI